MKTHKGALTPLLLLATVCSIVQAQTVYQSCAADDFRCDNGRCIDKSKRCDRVVNCPRGEDEKNCECTADEFRCANDGTCIELRRRCDGYSNCNDHSDEDGCETTRCRDGETTCSNGACATSCNGKDECPNGEDESNCITDDQTNCDVKCDGKCLDDFYICDGRADCSDGQDEVGCANCDGPDDFKCGTGECLPAAQKCNGLAECRDRSDEYNCNTTVTAVPIDECDEQQFRCRNGVCLNYLFRCDGTVDCDDKSDEENCSPVPPACPRGYWPCVSGGDCIPEEDRCNNAVQCRDGSDEWNCPTTPNPWATTPRDWITSTHVPYPNYPDYNTPRWAYLPPTPDRVPDTTPAPAYYPYPQEDGEPAGLKLKTYPEEQSVRFGGDVVFVCRDEGPNRTSVSWRRDGIPIKPGYVDKNGRLEINKVTLADSGVYICQADNYLDRPGSRISVELIVDNPPSLSLVPGMPQCSGYEATCSNGQCIARSSICDKKRDCSDGSDEDNCSFNGQCEPNEFQCRNGKCILKSWRCDSDSDCGDGSDEEGCGPPPPGATCRREEFQCGNRQCVPRSFHCDNRADCLDGSDEIGCAAAYVSKPPTPSNVELNPGDKLTLQCQALGVPTPLISWRLNWGHVPAKCTATSIDGLGVLTCPDMQPEDSGAYSCEAISSSMSAIAVPDAYVFVNRQDICPPGYFNSEARSQSECIPCFCFGESKSCKSADLFTYSIPTALGKGDTRLVGVSAGRGGTPELAVAAPTDYHYQSLNNGATVTKIYTYDQRYPSTVHPYLRLPEDYNKNQLTSYGGRISYRVAAHSPRSGVTDDLPTMIIKGKHRTLVYRGNNESEVSVRLTPENWQRVTANGLDSASREDIMMTLDHIEAILLRADHNNAGVQITDFSMESARLINSGLGAANLVEECTCPLGYEGLSCQKCANGYVRGSGPWLGSCVREEPPCPAGQYRGPGADSSCKPCPCPMTNGPNQFASSCSLNSRGDIVCNCFPGYGGLRCDVCEKGYIGNPLLPGNSCRYQPPTQCNREGTLRTLPPDECQCKDQVQGRYCDQCKPGSFFLSQDFRHGCALCFCSGVSQECSSSTLRRKTTSVQFNTPQIVGTVRLFGSSSSGLYKAPEETRQDPVLYRGDATMQNFAPAISTIYYWSLPANFAGDKVTSYGGFLRYQLGMWGTRDVNNNAADVQLISENRLTFLYFGNFAPSSDGTLNATVQFLEKGWQRTDGKEVPREQFLLALADVKRILIKASFSAETLATLTSASIDTAERGGGGPPALHVEQCVCPEGYEGTSCEDCAPGYTRSSRGLYLEHCKPCKCNDHSDMCHPETGECYNCRDNTAGENCELCAPGYEIDSNGRCVFTEGTGPTPGQGEITDCRSRCDSAGSVGNCDANGVCICKQNVEGRYCDRCRAGTFGPSVNYEVGCLPCYCSGVTDTCAQAGQYWRTQLPAPVIGDDYGGYVITDLNAEDIFDDRFVPAPDQSDLTYNFNFPPNKELFWSLPQLTGNRVTSYGGSLTFKQRFDSSYDEVSTPGTDVVLVGESNSVYWTNPNPMRSRNQVTYRVPLSETNWFNLNTRTPASRREYMDVLKDIKRILVRATLAQSLLSTSIADVEMDIATERRDLNTQIAEGVEVCRCPNGYSGTSCESCEHGYYKDQLGRCTQCNCNGNDCQLGPYDEVICHCPASATGHDCSIVVNDTTTRLPPPDSTINVKITNPVLRIQEVGTSVNFSCQVQSRMSYQPSISWSKIDGYMPRGRTIDNRRGLLIITNLQPEDSGIYLCEGDDGYSTDQAKVSLVVDGSPMTMPIVSIEPPVNDYYEGDRIELRCVTSGNPTPTISWQRADGSAPSLSVEFHDELMIIHNAQEQDSGEYRCVASNNYGRTDRTVKVSVRSKYPPGPGLKVNPSSVNVNEGQNTRVVCTGSPNEPPGSIEWVRQDGTRFYPNVHSSNGVLYIESAVPENQGVYVCQSPRADPVPATVWVQPLGPPSEPSAVALSTPTLVVPTGGIGSVDCIPSGYPQPLITWTKLDGNFGPGVSQRDNMLIINNAQQSDEGYYQCEGKVQNQLVAVEYLTLTIESREVPRVEIIPNGEQAVNLGGSYQLNCQVSGIPTPVVTWSRNGGRELSKHVSIINPGNVLRFTEIEVNDEGEYTCTATNVAGSQSATTVLKVRAQPEVSISPDSYNTVLLGASVDVECRATGIPEPFVLIRRRDGAEVVAAAPRVAVLRLRAASERDQGEYMCVASSPAGTVEEPFAIQINNDNIYEGSGMEPVPDTSEPVIIYEGKSRTIECNATGGRYVNWRRSDGSPFDYNVFTRGSSLIFVNATNRQSGDYECVASDSYGVAERAALVRVRVMDAPRITLVPKSQTVRPGESPTVRCEVQGEGVLSITWRPLGKPFSDRIRADGPDLIFNNIEVEDAGQYECFAMTRFANASASAEVFVGEPYDAPPNLVMLEQPVGSYVVGEDVEVPCRPSSAVVNAEWVRIGDNQHRVFVDSVKYRDVVMLKIHGVEESDAGVYRCTGNSPYGESYVDYNLEVRPASVGRPYPNDDTVYTANVGDQIDLPCNHNLEQPVQYEWRREFTPLSVNEANLHLEAVSEQDAGRYVCRVRNELGGQAEARAVLRVLGVVPQFNGDSWLSLPTIKDAYHKFDIEISFNPKDSNGLVLYNSENNAAWGKYLSLSLVDGVPQLQLNTRGDDALVVNGTGPLTLNEWHTVRVGRNNKDLSMYVDNQLAAALSGRVPEGVLELREPLFLGGVPDYSRLPRLLDTTNGFIGCISVLKLGREQKHIMSERLDSSNVNICDTCSPNPCQNQGVCQEDQTERGFVCLCPEGRAGAVCERAGASCRPGLCGGGRCADTADGYTCICPVSYTGRNCEHRQSIEYPAFTGSAYLAISAPAAGRSLAMSLQLKAASPLADGIVMYSAASALGGGGFMSLAVRNSRLEFTYKSDEDSAPVVLTANRTLPVNDWTEVLISRIGGMVSMKIDRRYEYVGQLSNPRKELVLGTPMYVGGVDEAAAAVNPLVQVTGGFNGCIRDVKVSGDVVDIVNNSIDSANVQECRKNDRGDIPEYQTVCTQCINGGYCSNADQPACTCPPGYSGATCERGPGPGAGRGDPRDPRDPCAGRPCQNGGLCRPNPTGPAAYSCECRLPYAGTNCQIVLEMRYSVGFNGDGFVELPASLLRYNKLDNSSVIIAVAFHTRSDGVLLYQRESFVAAPGGDFILLRVNNGRLLFEWDFGLGSNQLSIEDVIVSDGRRHAVIVTLHPNRSVTMTVDNDKTKTQESDMTTVVHADSNVYIGGIPDALNVNRYPGLAGCVEQVELMNNGAVNFGINASGGRNAQRCKEPGTI